MLGDLKTVPEPSIRMAFTGSFATPSPLARLTGSHREEGLAIEQARVATRGR